MLFERPSFTPGHPSKNAWQPEGPLEIFSLEHSLAPCSFWKSDTLHAIVKCGSAFIEDIGKAGMQISVNYPIHLPYMVVI